MNLKKIQHAKLEIEIIIFWIQAKIIPYTENSFLYYDLHFMRLKYDCKVTHRHLVLEKQPYRSCHILGLSLGFYSQNKGKSDIIEAQ